MLPEIILDYTILFFAVILHECAHGWVAYRFGDPTAKNAGRLTLNPLKHIDLWGTLVIPIVLKLLHFFPIGWAKPVPVNYSNLRNPRRDMIWVALAGPATNILLAAIFRLAAAIPSPQIWGEIAATAVFVNLLLAVFNLTPIPPLDGSRILMGVMPLPWARRYAQLEPWGLLLVVILLNMGLLEGVGQIALFLARWLMPTVRF